jgi:hypothetical protein
MQQKILCKRTASGAFLTMDNMEKEEKILAVYFANCVLSKSGISAVKYLEAAPKIGAVDSIKSLSSKFDKVYLVYKTTKDTNMTKVAEWIKHTGILASMNLKPDNVIFVDDQPKLAAVLEKIGATHFVHDDVMVANKLTGLDLIVVLDDKSMPTRLTPDEIKFMRSAPNWMQVEEILKNNITVVEV